MFGNLLSLKPARNCVLSFSQPPFPEGFKRQLSLLSPPFQQSWLQLEWKAYLPLQVSRGEFNQVSGVSMVLILQKLEVQGREARSILMPLGG